MELNDLVTLERRHLSWFWYPTHNIETYLGRGAPQVLLNHFPFHKINLLAAYFIMPGKDIIYSPATF